MQLVTSWSAPAQLGNIYYYVKSKAGRTGGISLPAPLMSHRGMQLVTSQSATCGATSQYLLCKINSWSYRWDQLGGSSDDS